MARKYIASIGFLSLFFGVGLYANALGVLLDMPSLMVVLIGAFCFGLASAPEHRLANVGTGALVSGFIGGLIGLALTASTYTTMETIGPALSVVCLTPLYGLIGWSFTKMLRSS